MNPRTTLCAVLALAATAALFCAGSAGAQDLAPRPALRAGYYLGNDFTIGAGKHHLEGFEVGADLPLGRSLASIGSFALSPTLTFGGSSRSGADTDGLIYRVMLTSRRSLGHNGAYLGIGLGYSGTQARVHEFSNVSGFASEYMLGYSPASAGRAQPFLEVGYVDGRDNKVRGWSLDAGLRF